MAVGAIVSTESMDKAAPKMGRAKGEKRISESLISASGGGRNRCEVLSSTRAGGFDGLSRHRERAGSTAPIERCRPSGARDRGTDGGLDGATVQRVRRAG